MSTWWPETRAPQSRPDREHGQRGPRISHNGHVEPPTHARTNPTRNGDGSFRRDLEHVERDADACRLASQGLSYAQIAARLGYSTKGDAYKAVQRVLWETARQHGTEELRQKQLAELNELRQKMWQRVNEPPPAVDRLGRIVTDRDGEVVPDVQAQVAAAAVVLRVSEREARLRGLDAPRRSVHMTGSAGVAEILQFIDGINPADLHAATAELNRKIERAEEDNRKAIPGSVEP